MRLTLINQFYRPDIAPTAQLAASLAEHRALQTDEVTVITGGGNYAAAGQTPSATENRSSSLRKPRVVRLWTPGLGKKSILKRLADYAGVYLGATWRMLTLPRQDVIVAMTTPPYIALTAMLHKAIHRKTRLVLWCMDCYPDVAERVGVIRRGRFVSRVLRWLNRFLFARIDHLICLDTAMVNLLVSQYAGARKDLPVSIIPNWEDLALFPADAEPPPWEAAQALGLQGKFVVLYLGNTGVGHAFETAIDAAAALVDENAAFLFVGGGARWDNLKQAQHARAIDNIVLQPYVAKEQTPSVMKSAGCALITLRDDSLGVMSPSKLHSNLAMGLPILYIGPAGSNVDDAIDRYGCGASFRHGDVAGVVTFIRSLMNDPAKLSDLRRRARDAFDDAYCDTKTLPQFDRILNGLQMQIAGGTAYANRKIFDSPRAVRRRNP